jgi:hypothetical protein
MSRRLPRRGHQRHARRDPVPELAQPLDATLGTIAGDQRGIDRADRHPGNPIRSKARFGDAFINARLVRPERAAALQHQDGLLTFCHLCNARKVDAQSNKIGSTRL